MNQPLRPEWVGQIATAGMLLVVKDIDTEADAVSPIAFRSNCNMSAGTCG
jgi:hypothetical protein